METPSIKDFEIKNLLGRGSYGEVFLVKKKEDNTLYALKTMDRVHMKKEDKQHHVFIERQVLSSFESDWLTKLYSCFQDQDRLYFLLENVSHGELGSYFSERRSNSYNSRKANTRRDYIHCR